MDQKHGLPRLEKCQFFDFLKLLFLSPRKVFLVLEYRKRHFLGLYWIKKKLEKRPFWDQNHGLTPLKKCQFFRLFCSSFFYSLERRFFVVEYRKGHFPMLYCLKKKRWKNAKFWTKKSAFLGLKNKKFKKSKNWHFSMEWSMELVQKWPFFQLFFFRQFRPWKFLLRYSRTKKRLSRQKKQEGQKV